MTAPVILWFRRDLRLSDQPALAAAAAAGPVIPVYLLDDACAGDRRPGGAARWWLHHSLDALAASLRDKGSRLILRRGDCAAELARLIEEIGACAIHAIRHYEPWWRDAETAVARAIDGKAKLCLHDGNYLTPPGSVTTGAGQPYRIFTPFWRALRQQMPPASPLRAPASIAAPGRWPASDKLKNWDLLPQAPDWASGFDVWQPGEAAARARVTAFAGEVAGYDATRNLPSQDGSSRLSPHLHHGELSPAYVWHRMSTAAGKGAGLDVYLSELAWRDFAQNLILQFPDYGEQSHRAPFHDFPWRQLSGKQAKADLKAWQRGQTGYPIVDAGMRQLWATGWMHNRVRMIAASFLIKHLLIDWREGERWFWDCLVDADYGSNSTNWQWVAGSGVDSNQFTRVMAPLTQSPKFDAAGYIRAWVPELAGLSDETIHDPESAGCRPRGYPAPVIGHREGRERALAAYREAKEAAA